MKKFIAMLLALVMVLSLVACGDKKDDAAGTDDSDKDSQDTITLKMHFVDPETAPFVQGGKKIAELVSEATDGRIQIEVLAGGSLGGERDTVELAMDNSLDIATCANSVLTNFIPEMGILDQAYLWKNADEAHAAVDGKLGDLIKEKAEALGLHIIGFEESGFRNTFSTKPIQTMADYTVTEAGFAADLGAEKFLDIKCRAGGFHPDAVVIVATVRALKYHGGVPKTELNHENLEALEKGLPNLLQHVDNVKNVYGLPCVVAINAFPTDTKAELDLVEKKCKELGVNVALSEVWGKGGEGGIELAKEVIRLCDEPNDFTFSYDVDAPIKDKIEAIVKKIYHGDGVAFTANAEKQIKTLTELGYDKMPICMAKTQYSFTDDQTKLGAPTGFTVTVRNVKVSAGAGFLVALTGEIMTMPGLPKVPAAEKIDVDETGKITGLF